MDKRYRDSRLIELEGHRGHHNLRQTLQPPPLVNMPSPPSWIKGEARKFYLQMVPILIKHNLLSNIDLSGFEVMAETWKMFIDTVYELRDPELSKTKYKELRRFQRVIFRELTAWFHEYGLTPPSRENLCVIIDEKEGENSSFS